MFKIPPSRKDENHATIFTIINTVGNSILYIDRLSFTQSEHTRTELLRFIQHSLNNELWAKNTQAIHDLKHSTTTHLLFTHPILNRLHQGQLSLAQLKLIHIHYFFNHC